jgi:hypothetical protein
MFAGRLSASWWLSCDGLPCVEVDFEGLNGVLIVTVTKTMVGMYPRQLSSSHRIHLHIEKHNIRDVAFSY